MGSVGLGCAPGRGGAALWGGGRWRGRAGPGRALREAAAAAAEGGGREAGGGRRALSMALRSSGLRRAAERRSDGQHGAQDAARYRRGRGEGRGVAEGRLRPRAGAEGGRRGCCERRRRGSRSLPASALSPPSFAFSPFSSPFCIFPCNFFMQGDVVASHRRRRVRSRNIAEPALGSNCPCPGGVRVPFPPAAPSCGAFASRASRRQLPAGDSTVWDR